MTYIAGLLSQSKVDLAVEFTLNLKDGDFLSYNFRKALRKISQSKASVAIFDYCSKILVKQPSIPLWAHYRKAGVAIGETDTILQLIDTHLATTKPDSPLFFKLLAERVATNLAVGDIEQAVIDIRKGLSFELVNAPAAAQSQIITTLKKLSQNTIRIGKLLGRPDLVEDGVSQLVELYHVTDDRKSMESSYARSSLLEMSCKNLIELGKFAEAENLITDEIKRKYLFVKGREMQAILGEESPFEKELSLLLALYNKADRHDDVLYLLDNFPWWCKKGIKAGSRKDTLLIVAESLYKTGQNRAAEETIKAYLTTKSDDDAFYRLLVEMKGSSIIPWLYEIYALDNFEERPLIWIAYLLKEEGKYAEAEKVIRQALKVDPTDGEQKAGDRVYAYTVLSETLESLGKLEDAQFFSNVVEAVRIAEKGDEYKKAGMLELSLEKYGEAQGLFADAYCVQWRMAERLYELGKIDEAKKHYEIAFERMPEQFGQVASFCFGCENVFDKKHSQSIAEEVLLRLEKTTPDRPQVYYLIGQLRESQGELSQAYNYYKKAVDLDPGYLDSWKKIVNLQNDLYHTQVQKDDVALILMGMDPMMRHYQPEFNNFGNIKGLWQALEKSEKLHLETPEYVYPLQASKELIAVYEKKAMELFPEEIEMRKVYKESVKKNTKPYTALTKHNLVNYVTRLMSTAEGFF